MVQVGFRSGTIAVKGPLEYMRFHYMHLSLCIAPFGILLSETVKWAIRRCSDIISATSIGAPFGNLYGFPFLASSNDQGNVTGTLHWTSESLARAPKIIGPVAGEVWPETRMHMWWTIVICGYQMGNGRNVKQSTVQIQQWCHYITQNPRQVSLIKEFFFDLIYVQLWPFCRRLDQNYNIGPYKVQITDDWHFFLIRGMGLWFLRWLKLFYHFHVINYFPVRFRKEFVS